MSSLSSTALTVTLVVATDANTARQGLAFVSPVLMASLGALPGDVVRLTGTRSTSVTLMTASTTLSSSAMAVDEVTLANLRVATGARVEVARVDRVSAAALTLTGDTLTMSSLDAPLVQVLLAGKSLSVGDLVSLTPQEAIQVDGIEPAQVADARQSLRRKLASGATTARLTVTHISPALATVTLATDLTLEAPGKGSFANRASTLVRDRARRLPGELHAAATGAAPMSFPTQTTSSPVTSPVAQATQIVQVPEVPETSEAAPLWPANVPVPVTVADLPHLAAEAKLLKEWFDLAFHGNDVLQRFGTRPQNGVLLSAPEGSGEVELVTAVAAELGVETEVISMRLLSSFEPAKALEYLMTHLDRAALNAPRVVVLSEIDTLAQKDKTSPLLPSFLDLLTRTLSENKLALVATTSRLTEVHPDVRRPGRLEHVLEARVPDRAHRALLLERLVEGLPLDADLSLSDIAAKTPGFVLADLRSLVQEAARQAAQRARTTPEVAAVEVPPTTEPELPGQISLELEGVVAPGPVQITSEDFVSALQRVKPSVMENNGVNVGSVTLEDVGGMEDVKRVLTETVLWPLTYPDTFARMGITPPRGVLLYGPPGCGKTFLVKAVASTGQANVFSVKGAELLSKWVGDSELAVRDLFRKAREAAPSIVFLDEIDALAPQRGQDSGSGSGVTDRVVAALLTELDGVEGLKDVVVIGATNRPDMVDGALLRPGRLEQMVFVAPPDAAAREAILRVSAKNTPFENVDWEMIAELADGYSSADCAAVVRQSALAAMRESLDAKVVTSRHVQQALVKVRPSLDAEMVTYLEEFADSYQNR